jgi:hypothetical protein
MVTNKRGEETGYIFDNVLRNGEYTEEGIKKYIENGGQKKRMFYVDSSNPYKILNEIPTESKEEKRIYLATILVSLYTGKDIDSLRDERISIVDKDWCWDIEDGTDKHHVKFYSYRMYNIQWRSSYGARRLSGKGFIEIARKIARSGAYFVVLMPDDQGDRTEYITEFRNELARVVDVAPTLKVQDRGALMTGYYNPIIKETTRISFAELVWGCSHDKYDTKDRDTICETVIAFRDELSESRCEVDHLTERKEVNFIWAICAMTKGLNQSLGAHRTQIKKPYYFYMVYDRTNNVVRVKCGVEAAEGERDAQEWRFRFGDLTQENEADKMQKCFNQFKKIVKELGFMLSIPSTTNSSEKAAIMEENSLLYKWANPELVNHPDNPLMAMLHEDVSLYSKYNGETFDNLINVF